MIRFGMTHTEAWLAYQDNPSQQSRRGVVDALHPLIASQAAAYGGSDSPHIRHQAKLMAADAVRTYDPTSGTKLTTWVQSNLRGLTRYRREMGSPVRIPERAQLDAWSIEKARRKYVDTHGDEPDSRQLADAASMPVKRIAEVMNMTRPMSSDSSTFGGSQTVPDNMDEALGYVYGNSDKTDRLIIEHLTGYGGKPLLQKQEIAAKLGVSPAMVTRRSDLIGQATQDFDRELSRTYG